MATEILPDASYEDGLEIIEDAFLNKVMVACRDFRTSSILEDELRKIMSTTKTVEDQRDLK